MLTNQSQVGDCLFKFKLDVTPHRGTLSQAPPPRRLAQGHKPVVQRHRLTRRRSSVVRAVGRQRTSLHRQGRPLGPDAPPSDQRSRRTAAGSLLSSEASPGPRPDRPAEDRDTWDTGQVREPPVTTNM